ncbi:hypothetical protein JEZ13_05115 [bacterium]|nr:hypothetical protein [bacterium]
MHKNRNKSWLSVILCLVALNFSFSLFAEKITVENAKIENFVVEDVPGDLGSGLLLKWKPLPNELKILEYRIYRGITPDSLFYSGSVMLNPVVGFAGEEISFLDSGFKPFVDKSSPGRLVVDSKVKPLDEKTFYFGTANNGYPRDLEVLAQANNKFSLIAQIEKGVYYSRYEEVTLDEQLFAGYPLGNVSVLARVRSGVEYFYSVVPLNETRKYLRPSEVVSGTPISDPLQKPARELYSNLIVDGSTPISLNFDWENATGSYSSQAAIYVFDDELEVTKSYFEATEENPYQGKEPFILSLDPQINEYGKFSQPIISENGAYFLKNEDSQLMIDLERIEDYQVVIQADNGQTLFLKDTPNSRYQSIQTASLTDLPQVPTFNVYDVPNDKGDTQIVVWEKPLVEITKTSFHEKLGKFLIVNYDYYDYQAETLKSFDLKLTLEGQEKPFYETDEFYLDNVIKLAVPDDYDNNTITAEIIIKTNNPDTEPYTLYQNLKFDKILKALIPSAIVKNNIALNSFNYEVYAKEGSPQYVTVAGKVVGKMNNYSDVISYERFLYESVIAFDPESGKVLVPGDIQVWYDGKTEKSLNLSKFASVSKEKIATEITTVEEEIAQITDPKHKERLENYQSSLLALQTELNNNISNRKWIGIVKNHRNNSLRQKSYKVFASNNRGLFTSYELPLNEDGSYQYFTPISNQFDYDKLAGLLASIIFAILVAVYVNLAKKGVDLYIRPIAGIQEIDNAIGRATEMGRPILFVPGMSSIGVVATLAALSILGKVAKKAAEYDTRILVPTRDFILMPIAQEIVKEAHIEAGRPDTFDKNSVFFITTDQFAYVAGVNGIMIREKTATNFYMGSYFAESLLMTETGNITGAIQIAGTDSVTQIPFFITTCDYTLIGEELYAASAYMSKEPMILGTLKAQDYFKFIILFFIIVGTILSTSKITFLLDFFPEK